MLTVYQLDDARVWLGDGPRQAFSKGHLQVLVAPPDVPVGQAARWETELCPVLDTPSFGDADTGSWELVEDHRKGTLYTVDGEYKIGDDYEGRSYDGLGPVPAWLTTEAPKPPEMPDPVPQQVTRAQGKAALITAGLWQNVLDHVAAITDPTKKALAEVALNDTSHWRRDSPFLNEAAQEIGLTDEQLDDLFRQATEILL